MGWPSGSKPAKPASADVKQQAEAQRVAKAEAAARDEERRLADQEKNRWQWRTEPDKDGGVYLLHSSERPPKCNGALRAELVRYQMGQIEPLKQLCWSKGQGSRFVLISDPEAYIFRSTKFDAASLVYIKSERENIADRKRKQAEEAREAWANYANEQRQYEVNRQPSRTYTIYDAPSGELRTCTQTSTTVTCF